MDDLDMDTASPGDVDRFLDRRDDVVRFVAEVSEVGSVTTLQYIAERDHFGAVGIAAGRREQPRGQAERTGREPLFEQSRHLLELGQARRPRFHAHHVEPQSVMADQHAGVDRCLRKAAEVLAKGGLAKRQPGRAGAQVILDQLPLTGEDRRDREPAMPDDLCCHTLPYLALSLGVDRQSEIGMGLDVDKARRDGKTFGIDRPGRVRRKGLADRRDPAAAQGDISYLARPAAAVDDEAAAD